MPDRAVLPAAALFGTAKDRAAKRPTTRSNWALLPGEPDPVGIEDAMTALSKPGIGDTGSYRPTVLARTYRILNPWACTSSDLVCA